MRRLIGLLFNQFLFFKFGGNPSFSRCSEPSLCACTGLIFEKARLFPMWPICLEYAPWCCWTVVAEDEAIAALLHDALEDHATEISREDIAKRFGAEVLAIVEACTDTPIDYQGGSKPDWRKRKTAYLEHLRKARPEKLRVALADKLDNVRSILADYRHIGDTLWTRFNAGKQDSALVFPFSGRRIPPGWCQGIPHGRI